MIVIIELKRYKISKQYLDDLAAEFFGVPTLESKDGKRAEYEFKQIENGDKFVATLEDCFSAPKKPKKTDKE